MTDSKKQSASKSPSHVVYHIRNREGSDGIWTRIGSAWAHADGNGFNVQLDTISTLNNSATANNRFNMRLFILILQLFQLEVFCRFRCPDTASPLRGSFAPPAPA